MTTELINEATDLIEYIRAKYGEKDLVNAMFFAKAIVLGDTFTTRFQVIDFYFAS